MTWWTRSGGTLGSRGLKRRDAQPAELLARVPDGEDEQDPQPVLPPSAVPRHWSRTPSG